MAEGKEKSRLYIGVIAFTVWISISSSSILVLKSGAPAPACAFWRLGFSTLVLLFTSCISQSRLSFKSFKPMSKEFIFIITSGLALATHFILWMESLFIIPVAVSVSVVVTYPLFNLIVDIALLHEKASYTQIAGMAVGLLGVLLFLNPSLSGIPNAYGVLLALGGALAATIYFTIGRILRAHGIGLTEYTIPVYGTATLFLAIYSWIASIDLIHYNSRTFLFFAMLAIIPMLGGHTLMNYLLKYMKSSSVTSIALGEPVGASLLAYLFLGEGVGPRQALLIALILAGVFTSVMEKREENH